MMSNCKQFKTVLLLPSLSQLASVVRLKDAVFPSLESF